MSDKKPKCFLRINDVLKRFPVSKSHWWHGVSAGKYPPPYKISAGITAWDEADIDSLIESVKEGSNLECP
jgi:predicted DNA-binding transcriptional regulator AlpA